MDLTDKIALVTGASKRIGREIALALGRAGADVVVHYNHSQSEAEATTEQVRALGVQAVTIRAADTPIPVRAAGAAAIPANRDRADAKAIKR